MQAPAEIGIELLRKGQHNVILLSQYSRAPVPYNSHRGRHWWLFISKLSRSLHSTNLAKIPGLDSRPRPKPDVVKPETRHQTWCRDTVVEKETGLSFVCKQRSVYFMGCERTVGWFSFLFFFSQLHVWVCLWITHSAHERSLKSLMLMCVCIPHYSPRGAIYRAVMIASSGRWE